MRAYRLEQVGGPALAQSQFELRERTLIGRGLDCQVILADAAVSRRHAQIEVRAGKLWLTDLESRAGSYINDLKLDPAAAVELNVHDRVRIAAWRFRVRSADATAMQSSIGPRGNSVVSLSGATQYAHPVLAAEARLELLVEFAAATVAAHDLSALATILLAFAVRATQADRASAWQAEQLAPLQVQPEHAPQALFDAFSAASTGGVVRIDQAFADTAYALVAAIRVDGEALGFIQLEFLQRKPTPESMEILHALARFTSVCVSSIERKSVELRMDRLRSDLEAAHQVQQAILPAITGSFESLQNVDATGTVKSGVRYALHVHPGRVVAGDLVDVFAINDRKIAFVLGDVSGAGFGAAMLMSAAQAYLHAELMETADAGLAATRCNHYLSRMGGGLFVTAWIAIFDLHEAMMQIVDAGHGHVQMRAADGACSPVTLAGAIPLAIDSEAQFVAETMPLPIDQRLIVYSDGVAEHLNEAGVQFHTRFSRALAHSENCNADRDNLLTALRLHGGGRMPDDDASLLVIERFVS